MGYISFGPVHVDLQIGPFIFGWFDSSLIIPRLMVPEWDRRYVAMIDVKPNYWNALVDKFREFMNNVIDSLTYGWLLGNVQIEQLKQVAERNCYWNTTKSYHPIKRNCQHYFKDLTQHLGLNVEFTYATECFFKQIREAPESDLKVFNFPTNNGNFVPLATLQQTNNFLLENQLLAPMDRSLVEGWKEVLRHRESFIEEKYASTQSCDRDSELLD